MDIKKRFILARTKIKSFLKSKKTRQFLDIISMCVGIWLFQYFFTNKLDIWLLLASIGAYFVFAEVFLNIKQIKIVGKR